MRKLFGHFGVRVPQLALWTLLLVLLLSSPALGYGDSLFSPQRPTLRFGNRGPDVILLQHTLSKLGYIDDGLNGLFDSRTEAAIRSFQSDQKIWVDGVVGPQTWSALAAAHVEFVEHIVQPGETLWDIGRQYHLAASTLASVNGLDEPERIYVGQVIRIPQRAVPAGASVAGGAEGGELAPKIELLHWIEVNPLFPAGTRARVTDVATGLSFEVQRLFGTLHADVEPVTIRDTETMREIFGQWSWERRAIILEVDGRHFAGSMNGQPHGDQSILDNGFPGHFCIHFLGSRTHGTKVLDPDHHRALLSAAGYHVTQLWLE